MIITRTPFRISFAGGGSDLASFYEKHEGCVLSTCINKYMYIMVHPCFSDKETTIKYKKTEIVTNLREIKHPIARQILLDYNLNGIEIASIADVPSGTGLGSSSAYAVGVLHTVNAYLGKYRSQKRLAHDACEIEIDKLGEPIGKQDQYGCSIGGMKFIQFLQNDEVVTTPIIMKEETKKELEDNLLMFYTGDIRSASNILKEQNESSREKKNFENLVQMTKLAYKLRESLQDNDLSSFGRILHEGWLLKKELTDKISNSSIDHYYDTAMQNGALGGKLLGAGGGGFLLIYCEKQNQNRLRSALYELSELDFKFDYEGTKVIHIGER